MHNHTPEHYICPFCLLIQGKESAESQLKLTDLIFQNDDVAAFIATRKYPNNQGHVLVVPKEHYENIYDLPPDVLAKVHAVSRDVALAIKSEYQCDGITLRQQNEPAGGQNIWHYHLHIIPRYHNDEFGASRKSPFDVNERAEYAKRLKNWFDGQDK